MHAPHSAVVTALFGAGEANLAAEHAGQVAIGPDRDGVWHTVDGELDRLAVLVLAHDAAPIPEGPIDRHRNVFSRCSARSGVDGPTGHDPNSVTAVPV